MATLWIIKMILAHLLAEFVFQPKKWIQDIKEKHQRSQYLYWNSLLTGALGILFVGIRHWIAIVIIVVAYFLISLWRSYRPDKVSWFIIAQLLKLVVIAGLWLWTYFSQEELQVAWKDITTGQRFWIIVTAYSMVSFPSGALIGQLTKRWSDRVPNNKGLVDAGKWIGILERMIILTLLLLNQYAAIGLLITAKGLLRYNEKESQEEKTEYVLIGSLLSIFISLFTGILTHYLLT